MLGLAFQLSGSPTINGAFAGAAVCTLCLFPIFLLP